MLLLSLASCAIRIAGDPNAIDPATGMSPLAAAIAKGDAKMVKALIKAGADIHAESYSDFVHLFIPIAERRPEKVQPFLDAGANIDLNDVHLYMTLDRSEENASFFAALISQKEEEAYLSGLIRTDLYNINAWETNIYRLHSPLRQAVHKQHIEIARLLLKAAEDSTAMVNRRYSNFKDPRHERAGEYAGHTPLTLAIQSGNRDMVKLLLDAGAETEIQTVYGHYLYSPLVAFMLDYGVDPNFPLFEHNWAPSPLDRAVQAESAEIVRLLLDAGALVNPPSEENYYVPLSTALWRSNIEIARMLLEAGAKTGQVFIADSSYVPLVWAVKQSNFDMVRLLINAGEDINLSIKNEHNPFYSSHTPLTQAIVGGDIEMVRLLLDSGADINTPGEDFFGPLQTAIENDNTALALELVAMGADLNPEKGTPPLHIAVSTGNVSLARALLEAGADVFSESEYEINRQRRYSPSVHLRHMHTMLTRAALLDTDTFT